jgi:hypothetical protein
MKALYCLLILTSVVLSSCATGKYVGREFDDLYYSHPDNQVVSVQKNVPLSVYEAKPDSLLQTSRNYLEFRKATSQDIESLKREGYTRWTSAGYFTQGRNMFLVNGKPCNHYSASEIIKPNAKAYQFYLDGLEKFEKRKKLDRTFVVSSLSWLGINACINIYQGATESYSEPYLMGVLAIPLFVLAIMDVSVKSQGIKLVRKAVDTYNAGLPISHFLPKPELILGFRGNRIGMMINF